MKRKYLSKSSLIASGVIFALVLSFALNAQAISKYSTDMTVDYGAIFNNALDATKKVFIDGVTGKVGIGAVPDTTTVKLDITGNGGNTRLISGQTGGHTFLSFLNGLATGARSAWIGFGSNGTTDLTISNDAGGSGDIGDVDTWRTNYLTSPVYSATIPTCHDKPDYMCLW